MTETASLLTSEYLNGCIENAKTRREEASLKEEKEILNGWMELLTASYIEQKIVEAGAVGCYSADLINDPYKIKPSGYWKHLFYDRIEPHSVSLKDHIESFLDTNKYIVYLNHEQSFPWITVHYNSYKLPEFCFTHPCVACSSMTLIAFGCCVAIGWLVIHLYITTK